jgi:hypothetical protein
MRIGLSDVQKQMCHISGRGLHKNSHRVAYLVDVYGITITARRFNFVAISVVVACVLAKSL